VQVRRRGVSEDEKTLYFDFAASVIFPGCVSARCFPESATTATALLWHSATYSVFSSSLSATPSGLAPGNASSASRTSMRSIS